MGSSRSTGAATDLLAANSVADPPVDVERIARSLGLRVVRQPFDGNISGMLHRQESGAVIGVNSLHADVRQRFTIAHEIGHFVLHRGKTFIDEVRVDYRDERSSAGRHRREIDANGFAAELLMPGALVRQAVGSQLDREIEPSASGFIDALASDFGVSMEAMSHRLTNLGINLQI